MEIAHKAAPRTIYANGNIFFLYIIPVASLRPRNTIYTCTSVYVCVCVFVWKSRVRLWILYGRTEDQARSGVFLPRREFLGRAEQKPDATKSRRHKCEWILNGIQIVCTSSRTMYTKGVSINGTRVVAQPSHHSWARGVRWGWWVWLQFIHSARMLGKWVLGDTRCLDVCCSLLCLFIIKSSHFTSLINFI